MAENPLTSTETPPGLSAAERRKRYAAAMDAVTGGICPTDLIDAVMAVADVEQRELASLAVNAANALRDERRHHHLAAEEAGRLREELRKAKRAADLLAADHRAVERVQRRLDTWEQQLPENVRTATVIDVLRATLEDAA